MKKKNTPASRRLNPQHEHFIREMIEHGDRCRAYAMAYPNAKGKSISNGAWKLMDDPHISGRINDAMKRMQRETEQVQTILLNEKLANLLGMREYIASMLSGKTKFKKHFKLGDKIDHVDVEANASETLRALELNLKLTRELPKGKTSFVRTVTMGKNKEEVE